MTTLTSTLAPSGGEIARPARRVGAGLPKTVWTLLWTAGLLVAGEAALRVRAWVRHGSAGPTAGIYVPDGELGRRLRPDATLRGSERRVTINSQGFRGPPVAVPKPPGRFRIAAVGDSTTFGMQASSDGAIWVAQMARLMGEGRVAPQGLDFDVVNAAVPGYTIDESAVQFERRVAPLDPDVVIIGQTTTDVAAHSRRQFRIRSDTQAGGSPVTRFFHKQSLLVNLLRQNTAALRSRYVESRRHDALDEAGVERYASRLERFVRQCQARGMTVVLYTCPRAFDRAGKDGGGQHALAATALANNPALSLAGLNDAFDRYNASVQRVAHSTGALLVDLDRLIPRGGTHFVDAVHFNDTGHALVGEIMAEAVRGCLAKQGDRGGVR